MSTDIIRTTAKPNFAMLDRIHNDGYMAIDGLFAEDYANIIVNEINRLIDAGIITALLENNIDDQSTEWLRSTGAAFGEADGGILYRRSLAFRQMFDALKDWARSYNRIASQQGRAMIAADGIELYWNKVINNWSGLKLHRDNRRFTSALMAFDQSDFRHQALLLRKITISGYFRERDQSGERASDSGGALVVHLPADRLPPSKKGSFDVLLSDHNQGAVFLGDDCLHGVSRMTNAGVRYSFQAFFPELRAWQALLAKYSNER